MELLSRYGCAWAVIEQVTGKRLADYLDEIIFTPLQMNSSTFNITPDIAERTADVYSTASPAQQASLNYDSDIPWKLVEAAWNFKETQPACDSGGGGLYGSISDYAAYLSMIANDGELNGQRILSSASMIEHLKDQTTQLLPEAFRRGFGEDASSYMKFSAGFGRKLDVDLALGRDSGLLFLGQRSNTFFWVDTTNQAVGVFATQLVPSLYINNEIEQIVDEAVIK